MLIYDEIPGVDKRALLQQWIADEGLTAHEAYSILRDRYYISEMYFMKVLDGRLDGSMVFWYHISQMSGRECIRWHWKAEAKPKKAPEPKPEPKPEPVVEKRKPGRPKTDVAWIARNLKEFGNCVISQNILKKYPDLQRQLRKQGIWTEIRYEEDDKNRPGLWVLKDCDLTFYLAEDDED